MRCHVHAENDEDRKGLHVKQQDHTATKLAQVPHAWAWVIGSLLPSKMMRCAIQSEESLSRK